MEDNGDGVELLLGERRQVEGPRLGGLAPQAQALHNQDVSRKCPARFDLKLQDWT